ncbi:TD and POZ domain-containing protein 2-like [Microplitis mediator]|uniref:TD and POZ domain-containing protein 2-like n=1 Tax=Microplitis mediator TaxID=375433 RepID=UPI00255641C5|nr:TD and POZ domain-containing protein 2-like [Microplitis mediator]
MTMNVNPETKVVKYRWNIDDVIDSKSWVQSEQFYLPGKDQVGFYISLRRIIGWFSKCSALELRVGKDDLRPAKATVQFQQILVLHTFDFEMDRAIRVEKISEINEWEEFFTVELAGFKNKSDSTSAMRGHVKLTLECKITWMGFIDEESENTIPPSFERFLKADEFSDITLIVDSQELPAHKVILSAHSPYFYAMLTTEMKEVKENRITVENFSLDVITEMLEFFYTGKTKASDDTDVALKMIEIAEMYQIIKLKEICESTLIKNMSINTVLAIASVADDLNMTQLRHKAIHCMLNNKKKIVDFPEFKDLCQSKPLLMFEFMHAIGKLCHCAF